MMESDGIAKVTWSPEAREAYCADTGMSADEADEAMAAENVAAAQAWQVYHAQHPAASVQDFARHRLRETLIEVGTSMGMSSEAARKMADKSLRKRLSL